MSAPPHRAAGRRLRAGLMVALLALLTLALAEVAYEAMFSQFMQFDDSGYLLISLLEYRDGGALYDQVYSQYGPGFFVLVGGALDLLGVALTGDGARFVTLVLWLASSFLTGLVLLRLTRSLLISASGLPVAFLALHMSPNEPLHPVGIIAFLLIAMVAAAVLLLPERPRAALATIGALAAALLSIKVNVGLLALAAVGFALVVTGPQLRRYHLPRIAASVGLVLTPFLLLSGNLHQGWALRYAAVVSLGALALAIVASRLPPAEVPVERHIKSLAVAVAGVLAVVILVPLLGGTSVSGLVEGIVLVPLELDDVFTIPLVLSPLAPYWCAAAVGAAMVVRFLLEGNRGPGDRQGALVGALRIAAGLAIWTQIADAHEPLQQHTAVGVGAALVWIAAVPAGEARPETSFLRAMIPALAILQLLHGYPVAGSQLGPGYLLLVVGGGICIADGITELRRFGASVRRVPATWWRGIALVPVAAFTLWLCLTPGRDYVDKADERYRAGVPLELPGAERLRLAPELATAFQDLVAGINENCRTFLTVPGLNSLYLYTGQDPPTGMNGTAWMWLFDSATQQEILDQVKDEDGLCVVSNQLVVYFWATLMGMPPERPLSNYLDQKFEVVERYGAAFSSYEIGLRPEDLPQAPPTAPARPQAPPG